MNSFLLAFSFIRVPKLFATLLLWPLVAGLGVAVTQIIATATYIKLVDEKATDFQKRIEAPDRSAEWLRTELFGSQPSVGELKVCTWKTVDGRESSLDSGCQIEPLDIALRVEDPEHFDATEHIKFFTGSAKKIHICKDCSADITINAGSSTVGTDGQKKSTTTSDVYTLPALGVYVLTDSSHDDDVKASFLEARQTIDHLKEIAGTIYFHPANFKYPVNITKASTVMILVINTAFLIIITLWLSLVGHRKVLQYFARNDALLPLVAACGKNNFYNSLWLITLLRVGFFLLASLPATYIIYVNAIPEETLSLFTGDTIEFLLWISGIISSLGVLTIIASIAELKQRHSLISFFYKYIPIFFFLVGTGTWIFTLFHTGSAATTAQLLISALPLLGLSPMVLSPIFHMDPLMMALHTCLASMLIVILLRVNSRWFAAHLEDI